MNTRTRLITLLTDFGTADWFVAAMKGVILGLQPRARLLDITHEIPPGDVRAGAFALAAAAPYFPRGTIHVAVVDPGVGTQRAALVVETAEHWFLGPDNGLLSKALDGQRIRRLHRVQNPRYLSPRISRTFHGRDVFAPAAAYLSGGLSCSRLGPGVADYSRLAWPEVRVRGTCYAGSIVYVDRFGNALSNLPNELVEPVLDRWSIRQGRRVLCPVAGAYEAVAPGRPVAVPGSTGYLEVAIRGGHAAGTLRLAPGARVTLVPR